MKRFYSFLLLLSLLLFSSVPTLAHPGRLDSNGGHHDRIHGGYHYHRGENAGKTQYNDKEYTTSETNYTYEYTTAERYEEEAEEYTNQKQTTNAVQYDDAEVNDKSFFEILFLSLLIALFPGLFVIILLISLFELVKDKFFKYGKYYSLHLGLGTYISLFFCILFIYLNQHIIAFVVLILILMLSIIVWCIVSKTSNDKGYQKHLEEERIKEEQRRLEEMERQRKIAERKRIFNQEREKYLVYENKNKTEIFNIYFKTNINIIFDDKNLPVPLENQEKFGEYTVFTSHSGRRFHYKKGCSGATIPHSIFKISRRYYSQCGKCMEHKKELPVTEYQHSNFLSLLSNLDYYNINIKDYDAK